MYLILVFLLLHIPYLPLFCRYAMEKMRALDGKLKHQIDRLMKLSTQSSSENGSSSLRPNPLALLSKGGDDEDSEEEGGSGSRGKLSKTPEGGEFYRAPKMSAAPYKVHSLSLSYALISP